MRGQETVGHVRANGSGGVLGCLERTADVVVVPLGILHHTDGNRLTVHVVANLAVLVPSQAILDLGLTRCGNDGTEVHDGMADLAVGTASIAVFGSGRSLVLQRHGNRNIGCAGGIVLMVLHAVVMTAVPIGVPGLVADVVLLGGAGRGGGVPAHLGIHLNGGAGEGSNGAVCIGNKASVHLNVDIHRQNIVRLLVFGIHPDLTGMVSLGNDGIQLPRANRNGDQSGLAGQLHVTGLGDGHGGNILIGNQGIRSAKALGHIHVIQMPCADIVQIQRHGDGIHTLNGGGNHVHVVQGAQKNAVSGRIVGDNHHGRTLNGIDNDLADHGCLISHAVADRELHHVEAVGQSYVCQHHLGILIPGKKMGQIHVIHVDLARSSVDTGCGISHCGGKADSIGRHGHARKRGILAHIGGAVGHIAEQRSLAVLLVRGVFHRNVVNVEGVLTVDIVVITVLVPVVAVLLGNIELQYLVVLQERSALILADVHADVVPAGLLQRVDKAGLGLDRADVGVAIGGSQMLPFGVDAVELGVDTQTDGLIGDIDPHTDGLGVLKDLGLTAIQGTQRKTGLQ